MKKRIILRKVRKRTLFTILNPIIVEPLELEYLRTICNSKNLESYISDDIFSDNENYFFEEADIFVLTGYNVSESQIHKEAEGIKSANPSSTIIVGGVHIERNFQYFHKDYIDYVIHSHDLKVFGRILDLLIEARETGEEKPLGYDYRTRDGSWIVGSRLVMEDRLDILADRSLLKENINKTRYLDKERVALAKASIACPYRCSFCYCREINNGRYIGADYKKLVEEIGSIEADYVWIVDDICFSKRSDLLEFIEEIKVLKSRKKIIAYLRADFIIKEEDLLRELVDLGLDEVIIGFEAVSEEELKNYKKDTKPLDYPKVIRILKELNLDYSALFMLNPDYGFKDFSRLHRFIGRNKIDLYTISIFTPLKGTEDFQRVRDELTRKDPKYFDFLHLVTKSKLPRPIFYLLFWALHLRLLKSKRVWTYIRNNLSRKKNERN